MTEASVVPLAGEQATPSPRSAARDAAGATQRSAPFDAAADGYDASFAHEPLARHLRQLVWTQLERLFAPGARVLDLGCGSGEDARWLAAHGCRVTAVDASAAMLAAARHKLAAAGLDASVAFAQLDLAELDPRRNELLALAGGVQCDGALADFGSLNCLADRRPLGAALARTMAPGGRFVAVVMGPVCAWEIAWHLAHGEPRRALRRLRREAKAPVSASNSRAASVSPSARERPAVPIFYPSARQLRRELAPWFRCERVVSVGALVPPPYLGHLARRWPRLVAALAAVERVAGALPPLPSVADHYLAVFVRREPAAHEQPPATATSRGAAHSLDGDPLAGPPGSRWRRALWRRVLWWRFLAADRRRHGRTVVERLDGRRLRVDPGVFNPVLFRTAATLAAGLRRDPPPPGAQVLDLGTGSGIGALLALAADPSARAVAVDVDERAVRCAGDNASTWGVGDRLDVRQGDLFGPVAGERFDLVLFHPPFWRRGAAPPPPALRGYERAFYADLDLPRRFADGLRQHLTPGGNALLLLSSDGEESAFLGACRDLDLAVALVLRRDLGNELLSVYRLRPRDAAPAAAAEAALDGGAGGAL